MTRSSKFEFELSLSSTILRTGKDLCLITMWLKLAFGKMKFPQTLLTTELSLDLIANASANRLLSWLPDLSFFQSREMNLNDRKYNNCHKN
jgi:hypothetical protein